MEREAIVLVSGGMDSAVCLMLACWGGYRKIWALTFYYGQRHACEIRYARELAQLAGAEYHYQWLDSSAWKQVPLVSGNDIPQDRPAYAIRNGGVPSTFVPGRNVVMLSYAMALAGIRGGADIFIGTTAEDQVGYADCRPIFFKAFEHVTETALPGMTIRLLTPLVEMSKRGVAELGQRMAVDFARTWSCYQPESTLGGERPCGRCDACVLRAEALAATEPTP